MQPDRHPRAFTLIELLVVMGIMAILLGIAIPSVASSRASKLNAGLITLSETLDLARHYAVANNTYVWVLLSPPAGGAATDSSLKVAIVASISGTDSLGWTTSTVTVADTSAPGSDLRLIHPVQHLPTVAIQDTPGVTITRPTATAVPLNQAMKIQIPAGGQLATFTSAVQFTPAGEALTSASMSRYIEVALYPQTGKAASSPDQAVLRIAGITGITSIYRP